MQAFVGTGHTPKLAPGPYASETPTASLRFIARSGYRILQQRWEIFQYDEAHQQTGKHEEWRDVPFADADT